MRSSRPELGVFAAASLGPLFRTLETQFERAYPVDVLVHLAGSQILATQLIEGADADVFASANGVQIQRVETGGRLRGVRAFAHASIVIVLPQERGPDIREAGDLAAPGRRVAMAGPDVPVGAYARAALEAMGLRAAVERNVISREMSVRQVVSRVLSGEADAGIAYASEAHGSGVALRSVLLDPIRKPVATYYIGVLADASSPEWGRRWVSFLGSAEGEEQLRRYGFTPSP